MAADGEGLGGKDVEAGNINHPFRSRALKAYREPSQTNKRQNDP